MTCLTFACLYIIFTILFFAFTGQSTANQLLAYKGMMALPLLFASFFIKDVATFNLKATLKSKYFLMCILMSLAILLNWHDHHFRLVSGNIPDNLLMNGFTIIMVMAVAVILLNQLPTIRKRLAIAIILSALVNVVLSLNVFPWLPMWLALTFLIYRLLAKIISLKLSICLAIENLCISPIVIFYLYQFYKTKSTLLINQGSYEPLVLLTLGVLSALGLAWLSLKACQTPCPLMKWLQFISPTSQFLLALFIFRSQSLSLYLIPCILILISLILYFFPYKNYKH